MFNELRTKLLPQQTPSDGRNPPKPAITQLRRIWVTAVSHGHPESDSTLLEGPDPAADFPGRGSKTQKRKGKDGRTSPADPPPASSGTLLRQERGSKCIPRPALQPFPALPSASPPGFGRNRLHIQLPSEVKVPRARSPSPGGCFPSPTPPSDPRGQGRAAQHSSGLGLAPWNTLSASSRNSWKDTTAQRCGNIPQRDGKAKPPQAWELPKHLRYPSCRAPPPPAPQDAQQTDRQTHSSRFPDSPRESQRGGEKENTREKPQEKPHSALPGALTQPSRQHRGMEKALPAPTLPVPGGVEALVARVPFPAARPRASGLRALAHLLGCCPDILFPKY